MLNNLIYRPPCAQSPDARLQQHTTRSAVGRVVSEEADLFLISIFILPHLVKQ
jgi:hypothetical protein